MYPPSSTRSFPPFYQQALSKYVPDPVRALIDQNDLTLWNVYLYYAVNGNAADGSGTASGMVASGHLV